MAAFSHLFPQRTPTHFLYFCFLFSIFVQIVTRSTFSSLRKVFILYLYRMSSSSRASSSENSLETSKRKKRNANTSRIANSFLLFSNENRTQIFKENPGLKNTEISKLLGEKWRNLHPDTKKISLQNHVIDRSSLSW